MKEPILLIMAAGMGSRYGGLKQMDPIGPGGELIIDFSLYDAVKAGFKKAVFIIKKETEEDFRAIIGKRAGRFMETEYAFQALSDIPAPLSIPKGREKPWGTCHAVLSAKNLVDGPFAVINADDFYGADAFGKMYDFLSKAKNDEKIRNCMIGYKLINTLTEHGHVARGVCGVSKDGFISEIVERTKVKMIDGKIMFSEDEEKTWTKLRDDTAVSMNFWGFQREVMDELSEMLPLYISKIIENNPLKGEFFLPLAVEDMITGNRASFKVITTDSRWYGVTYKEDKASVAEAFQSMKDKGVYPEVLW